ncbi:CLUMA_CG004573, isoform A [Clunio marinus]|uniref:CLUMA_CG004573, isoform A n=1 Tax=Clunio marinus TaxID=568069 RepID=A0A1J1HU38_9DIPT|nr:CLUMA_CG004573, isoform A [Clunio marinus]
MLFPRCEQVEKQQTLSEMSRPKTPSYTIWQNEMLMNGISKTHTFKLKSILTLACKQSLENK